MPSCESDGCRFSSKSLVVCPVFPGDGSLRGQETRREQNIIEIGRSKLQAPAMFALMLSRFLMQ